MLIQLQPLFVLSRVIARDPLEMAQKYYECA